MAKNSLSHLSSLVKLTDKQFARIITGDVRDARQISIWRSGWVPMTPQIADRVSYLVETIEPLADNPVDRRVALVLSGGDQSLLYELEKQINDAATENRGYTPATVRVIL